jgi:hypothetical protein
MCSVVRLLASSCFILYKLLCIKLEYLVRALGIGAMIYTNIQMASYLMRALEKTSSLSVTVVSSASNFLFSVIIIVHNSGTKLGVNGLF